MSCLAEMMPLPIVSPNGDRVVDHRFLLGVASSSDRPWLHRVRGVTLGDDKPSSTTPAATTHATLSRPASGDGATALRMTGGLLARGSFGFNVRQRVE